MTMRTRTTKTPAIDAGRRLRAGTLLLLAAVLWVPLQAPAADGCYRDARPAMGSLLQITLCGAGDTARGVAERTFARVAALDSELTTWADDGPMIRFNAAAGSGPQPVPAVLHAALGDARLWAERTDGLFDPTLGPVLSLWRKAAARGELPAEDELAQARARSGYQGLVLRSDRRAELMRPGMEVDLGAIGKGWALDRLASELPHSAGAAWLLDFGGSSFLAHGTPPGADAWRVAIRRDDGSVDCVVELRDGGLSVSGAHGRRHEIAGKQLSHIIDPRTGRPVRVLRFAIVAAPSATAAEALSTALVVASRADAPELGEGVWVRVHEEGAALRQSAGFPLAALPARAD